MLLGGLSMKQKIYKHNIFVPYFFTHAKDLARYVIWGNDKKRNERNNNHKKNVRTL